MSAQNLIDRLEGVRSTGPDRWIAKCPAHDDRGPSLAIREADDGKTLLHCFAGCGAADVIGAVGLEFADLFPEKQNEHRGRPERRPFPATDLLKLISKEALICAVALDDIGAGRELSPYDKWRATTAAMRIRNALHAGGL